MAIFELIENSLIIKPFVSVLLTLFLSVTTMYVKNISNLTRDSWSRLKGDRLIQAAAFDLKPAIQKIKYIKTLSAGSMLLVLLTLLIYYLK